MAYHFLVTPSKKRTSLLPSVTHVNVCPHVNIYRCAVAQKHHGERTPNAAVPPRNGAHKELVDSRTARLWRCGVDPPHSNFASSKVVRRTRTCKKWHKRTTADILNTCARLVFIVQDHVARGNTVETFDTITFSLFHTTIKNYMNCGTTFSSALAHDLGRNIQELACQHPGIKKNQDRPAFACEHMNLGSFSA